MKRTLTFGPLVLRISGLGFKVSGFSVSMLQDQTSRVFAGLAMHHGYRSRLVVDIVVDLVMFPLYTLFGFS